jgi:hypothetical protein
METTKWELMMMHLVISDVQLRIELTRLGGDIGATVGLHEDPAVLCSTVSTQNG